MSKVQSSIPSELKFSGITAAIPHKMKVLAIAIQKGGQGKTASTCNLAFDFAERGLRVAVIDLDTQQNATWTLEVGVCDFLASSMFKGDGSEVVGYFGSRNNAGLTVLPADPLLADLEKLELKEVAPALAANIAAMREFFDVCLIDTPPSLGNAMTSALLVADYVMSPVELETYSLQGMKKMVSVIGNLRKSNPRLQFLGMLPNLVSLRKPRHVANLAKLRAAYPALVMPFNIRERDSIAEAMGDQVPVWQVKKTAARAATKEVRVFAQYVYDKMEIGK